MSGLRVYVYAICKDEASFVDRWMDSMGEADQVVVTDTGSRDDTAARLRARGAVVHERQISPWRFDAARNASLDAVPGDADICVCTDLDEVFAPGWRRRLEQAWRERGPGGDRPVARLARYLYNWSLKPDGTPDVQFYVGKVHSRQGFLWKCPIHEHLEHVGEGPFDTFAVPDVVLSHYPDPAKSRGSYLPLLEMAVEEEPGNERMRYYLGREYLYKGRWQACVDTLGQFLALPTARWEEERCAAMRWMAKASAQMGKIGEAYRWYYRAIAEAPHLRDGYVEFARLAYERGDWPLTYFLTKEALRIEKKSESYVNMGYSWDHTPDDLCAIAASRLGMPAEALIHARRALELTPHDPRLGDNVRKLEEAVRVRDPGR